MFFDNSHFAKTLRVKRAERGWTQADLAKAAGVNEASIVRYESGTNCPTISKACDIANAFGCSIDEFVLEKEPA